jgi:hypothetical protein
MSLAGKLMRYGVDTLPQKKLGWGVLGARRQNLSRLRVEKLGCAGSRDACLSRTCGSSCPGSIYPLRSEFASRPSPRVSGRWVDRGFVPPPLCRVPLSARSFLRVLRCSLLNRTTVIHLCCSSWAVSICVGICSSFSKRRSRGDRLCRRPPPPPRQGRGLVVSWIMTRVRIWENIELSVGFRGFCE